MLAFEEILHVKKHELKPVAIVTIQLNSSLFPSLKINSNVSNITGAVTINRPFISMDICERIDYAHLNTVVLEEVFSNYKTLQPL